MLSIGRALLMNPDLLLFDEPTEGLAPLIVDQVVATIQELKQEHQTILLVEQNLSLALDVADYVYIMNKGVIVFNGKPEDLRGNRDVQSQFLRCLRTAQEGVRVGTFRDTSPRGGFRSGWRGRGRRTSPAGYPDHHRGSWIENHGAVALSKALVFPSGGSGAGPAFNDCKVIHAVGGMLAYWTCNCPTPHSAERAPWIEAAAWHDILARARRLLGIGYDLGAGSVRQQRLIERVAAAVERDEAGREVQPCSPS